VRASAGRLATLALVSLLIAGVILSAGCLRHREGAGADWNGQTPLTAPQEPAAADTPLSTPAPADGDEIDLFEPFSEDEDFGDVI
jgi:hypothetical protein